MLVVCGAIAAACVEDDAMDNAGQDMSAALAEADAENDRHAAACNDVSSTAGMLEELAQHEDTMAGVMERMDDARERMRTGPMMGMGHCSGPSFDHMSGSLADAHSEMSGHSERLRAAGTLDTAQSECASHTDTMRDMMRGMMDDLHSMPCMGM
jgi:hypothetical protein